MKLKKGSLEAKRFMAKIRAMKSGTKKKATKKIGATKFVEKKETKSTKPKRTLQITRRTDGSFKKFKQIGATKFVEKKETKRTKPKRTIQITRRADGTFKKFKSLSGQNVNFKKHLVYKKFLIDVVELSKGGYEYIVNSNANGRDIPIYFADSLIQAKKFIDRTVYLSKKIK